MRSWLYFIVLCLWLEKGLAQTPEWIWAGAQPAKAGETRFFRKTISIPFTPQEARLIASGDDQITVFINGEEVGQSANWRRPIHADVLKRLKEGQNVLAIRGRNDEAGPAGVVMKLEVRSPNNFGLFFVTDKSWIASEVEEPGLRRAESVGQGWKPAVSLGAVPGQPWGNVFGEAEATSPEKIIVPADFKVELLRSARADEGSWICMTFDDKGRIIVSPEKLERPLLLIEVAPGGIKEVKPIASPMRAAMGLCYVHDSLYVNGHGPGGVGLYRLIDSNGNGQFDPGEERLLKNFEGDSEHGYHAVLAGPDGMIYVINGNMTKLPADVSAQSPLRNFREDLLLPRMWDPTGHAREIYAPGGHILRTDPDGREWTLFCGGFRNAYDFDFDPNGELFTFDSDMEYDIGLPWYRPTRVLHCVSGADFGWRSGSGKWPEYYPDSLPAAVDVGLSSPTGVKFGARSNFPRAYRNALFICDWNYGRILTVQLEPKGSSFKGAFEPFLSGKPLPVVDMEFAPDGALYFITGGWRTQSGLYRVSFTGSAHESVAEMAKAPGESLRRRLEFFHDKKEPKAIDVAWPYLSSSDPFNRNAARIAIEVQDLSLWLDRALAETDVTASLTALLAVARCAPRDTETALFEALDRTSEACDSEEEKLAALRILQIAFSRMGRPVDSLAEEVRTRLLELYPSPSARMNQELCSILVYLQEPEVVPRSLARMAQAPTQQEQIALGFALRNFTNRWSSGDQRAWFNWCGKALRDFNGGVSFKKYLENARREMFERIPAAERAEMAAIGAQTNVAVAPQAVREFVREWTLEELTPHLPAFEISRDISAGRAIFLSMCAQCHRFGNDGGVIGPDLTALSSRFGAREILENTILPSLIISDRYATVTITRLDGEELSGMVLEESAEKVTLQSNPLTPITTEIRHGDIRSRVVSKVSLMPEALLNQLTRDEIFNLLAFLQSGTKPP